MSNLDSTSTADHKALVSLAVRWLRRRCSIVFAEFATLNNETPDAIGWKSGFSTLIECKASRSDFLSDAKKISRRLPELGIGRHRYYLCPAGIININDLRDDWGLLWEKRGRIYAQKEALPCDEWNEMGEIRFLVSMLTRVQIRIGDRPISEWLRHENMYEAKRQNLAEKSHG